MPKISEFFGISIYMYYREHQPLHFHAIYGDDEALISIETLSVIAGQLSPRVMGLVIEWATIHQKELVDAWSRAKSHQPLPRIEPLS